MIESRYYFSSPATELDDDVIKHIVNIIGSVDTAAFLVSADCIDNNDPDILKKLVETVQALNIAVLISDDVASMNILLADGVQIASEINHFKSCRQALGDRFIIGAYVGSSKHEAMLFGELHADYVAFGPDIIATNSTDSAANDGASNQTSNHGQNRNQAVINLAIWWREMFAIPAIAYLTTSEKVENIKFIDQFPDFVALLPEFWANKTHENWLKSLNSKSLETKSLDNQNLTGKSPES
ncbi:MAG: thiamine phosphate synthase [Rhizobiales bacterium]|nr:thiamine phosphate synthase [Hyphomicrobiales bacterium]